MSEGIICQCGDDGHDWDPRSVRGEQKIRSRCRNYAADQNDPEGFYLCAECDAAEHEPLDGRLDELSFKEPGFPIDSIDPGPYMSEDGDGPEMFYPSHRWGWNEARHDAAGMARLSQSVAIYRGKGEFWISNEESPRITDVPGYHFEAVER